jgi:glycosyltransferase involved in cell wall biosynthesis
MYFVQDYEPFFMDDYPDYQKEATASYTLIPDCQLFGISDWVRDTIQEKHNKPVHLIDASFDQELFYPDAARPANAVPVISAMIRPTTAWRGPKRSMRVLKALKDHYGDAIEIRTFGCPLAEIGQYGLETEFEFFHYEILGRRQVAQLLQASDIFLDLSDFQAFGRTALEAMACGCAVVAPLAGGVHTYATDGEDILLADTSDDQPCLEAAMRLIDDVTLQAKLAAAGIETGMAHSVHRSSLSFIQLLHQLQDNAAQATPAQAASNR